MTQRTWVQRKCSDCAEPLTRDDLLYNDGLCASCTADRMARPQQAPGEPKRPARDLPAIFDRGGRR